MITYQEEKLIDCMEDIKLLLQDHWKEVANHQDVRPLDVDWDVYKTFPNLAVYTMRTKDKLVGYAAFFINYHPHYRTWVHAVSDVYYVDPEYRGDQAVRFFQFIERSMKLEGVNIINIQDKIHKSRERFFKHLGFNVVEQVYEKVL